ncbi:unnamed protein product [Adineta ricciae]|uniref:Uncharacterized protein n=1 Tax=Adineta ricciae TaxID=249248 RepID=A0A814WD24_ADIRI|nr:unnamed protein product [Adineta ricciae]
MDCEECNSVICLDWREICDGKIDCSNGLDEYHCYNLEKNECNPDSEYRYSNGQCIDKILYRNHYYDCMDDSDETVFLSKSCNFFDPLMHCENYPCHSLLFSCGDGHCYNGPNVQSTDRCETQRDRLYFNQMPSSTLILYSHIHLIYNDMKPELIRFNQTSNELTCRLYNTFTDEKYTNFDDMLKDVKRFVRSCSLLQQNSHNCSLFQCNDQSKCLSYHRLLDGVADCANEEDEYHPNSCSFQIPYRFACDNGTRCISQRLVFDRILHCSDKDDGHARHFHACRDHMTDQCRTYQGKAPRFDFTFSELCNGIIDRMSNISNDTDESHCDKTEWPCSTYYNDCNHVWNCPDGSDGLNTCLGFNGKLTFLHCNNTMHFCLDIQHGFPICLPKERANDGIINCVGSIDEQEFCRLKYPGKSIRGFRCNESDICIQRHQICNCHQDCPNNDDETTACVWLNNGQATSCDPNKFRCRDGRYTDNNNCNDLRLCSDGEHNLFCQVDNNEIVKDFSIDRIQEHLHRNTQPSSTLTNIIL